MRVDVARPEELGEGERERWRSLMLAEAGCLDQPFLAPEFAQAVGRVRSGARVAVLSDRDGIAGFFAFERRGRWVGKPIGAGVSDFQAVVCASDFDLDPQALLAGCGLAVWEFDHLVTTQSAFDPYRVVATRSPIIDVAGGYEAYLAERRQTSKSLVSSLRRKERKLSRDVGPVRFVLDSRDESLLERLMEWKSAQYRRTGVPDRFSQPWVLGMIRHLLRERSGTFAAPISVLWAGSEPVAVHLGLRSHSVLSWWFPTYNPLFAAYSPGGIMLLRMAEAAAAAGLERIDLGRGEHSYKRRFASWDLPISEGWVERPSVAARVRRIQRIPHRFVLSYVVDGPLETPARALLRTFGRARTAWSGRASESQDL